MMSARRGTPRAAPWAHPAADVLEELGVADSRGLDAAEVQRRRQRFGSNRLREIRPRGALEILIAQLWSVIVLLLLAAAAVSFVVARLVEAVAILAVIVLNTAIGFAMELRAVRSMEALRRLGQVQARVRRDGELVAVPAAELVPGDIVVFEGGDVVTSDVRLIEANRLQADESALTGESLPVGKSVATIALDAPLGERWNMLFKGTAVTRGSAEGVVVATGMRTELGRISELVLAAEDVATPLEERLARLGRRLVWLMLAIAVIVAVTGLLAGHDAVVIFETTIALAVATVPEGLPIVATLALARGMWRMAREHALVNRLSAVETLGATSVIITDKTGTLTENRLSVARVIVDARSVELTGDALSAEGAFMDDRGARFDPASDARVVELLTAGALCNNAALHLVGADATGDAIGEPLEVALLVAAAKAGISARELERRFPELREEAFDPETRMMATFHRDGTHVRVAVKGSPEAVMQACTRLAAPDGVRGLTDADRARIDASAEQWAARGLRMLALAGKQTEDESEPPYSGLVWLGLAGMHDPPRQNVRAAIAACHAAGVSVVMATGDQVATAASVAGAVGLDGRDPPPLAGSEIDALLHGTQADRERVRMAVVLARTSPRQKLDLIELHQRAGSIVAMVGDGVNDAPALHKADIGVAMGRRGTQVAREAADMVLEDDELDSVVVAIREGRIIFGNIRNFAVYLLSCNVSELFAVGAAPLLGLPLPVLPLQILFLNLVTDVFPALALGAGEGERDVLERKPAEFAEQLLERRHWMLIWGYGVLVTAVVLVALGAALRVLGMPEEQAVTVSFLALGFAQLTHVFNMRAPGTRLRDNEVTRNRWVWGALALCTALLLIAVYAPLASRVLGTTRPGLAGWLVVGAASVVPLVAGQLVSRWRRR